MILLQYRKQIVDCSDFSLNIYFIRKNENWEVVSGKLKVVSVGGTEIWGVNSADNIYKKSLTGNWVNIGGKLKQISVSDLNRVWGVNSGDNIYRRNGNSWQQVEGKLKCVSVGQAGVWGVNSGDNIYYRTGTYGDANTAGTAVCAYQSNY